MLTNERIKELASRKGAKQCAVENFLCSLGSMTQYEASMNLHLDARSYKWNRQTVEAIKIGIREAGLKP